MLVTAYGLLPVDGDYAVPVGANWWFLFIPALTQYWTRTGGHDIPHTTPHRRAPAHTRHFRTSRPSYTTHTDGAVYEQPRRAHDTPTYTTTPHCLYATYTLRTATGPLPYLHANPTLRPHTTAPPTLPPPRHHHHAGLLPVPDATPHHTLTPTGGTPLHSLRCGVRPPFPTPLPHPHHPPCPALPVACLPTTPTRLPTHTLYPTTAPCLLFLATHIAHDAFCCDSGWTGSTPLVPGPAYSHTFPPIPHTRPTHLPHGYTLRLFCQCAVVAVAWQADGSRAV